MTYKYDPPQGGRRLGSAALALALAFIPTSARAQPSPADSAAGAVLFEDAQKLMAQGKYAEACAKFDASRKLVESAGAMLNLALCYEKAGRTGSAYGAWQEAGILARRLNDTDRNNEAMKRIRILEPSLSKLVLDVAPENRGKVTVQQNGRPVLEAVWGSEVPVDPGEHTIDAMSPGKKTWTMVVRIEAKPGTTKVTIPKLDDAPVLGPVPAEARPFWGPQRIAAIAVGGAGLIGLVIGAAFGVKTLGKTSDAKAHCSETLPQCDPTGLALHSEAATTAKVADVGLIVGGAAVVGGVVLFLTAPSATPTAPAAAGGIRLAPRLGAHNAGLMIEGAW